MNVVCYETSHLRFVIMRRDGRGWETCCCVSSRGACCTVYPSWRIRWHSEHKFRCSSSQASGRVTCQSSAFVCHFLMLIMRGENNNTPSYSPWAGAVIARSIMTSLSRGSYCIYQSPKLYFTSWSFFNPFKDLSCRWCDWLVLVFSCNHSWCTLTNTWTQQASFEFNGSVQQNTMLSAKHAVGYTWYEDIPIIQIIIVLNWESTLSDKLLLDLPSECMHHASQHYHVRCRPWGSCSALLSSVSACAHFVY